MNVCIYYETVTEAINDLAKRGYTTDFSVLNEAETLILNNTSARLSPDEFKIDETYRFDGNTDPGDEMIVFAISSAKHNIKGIVVNAYGMYSDSSTSKIVEQLQKHVKKDVPIKRNPFLKSLSREHHHALLLCWKIKTGFSKGKGVSAQRIKKYADWFYTTHLLPHFDLEEKYVFPVLDSENKYVKEAIAAHRQLSTLFSDTSNIENSLKQIQVELEKHIRFEERILFNEIQKSATPTQLEKIKQVHTEEKFVDNLSDVFWL